MAPFPDEVDVFSVPHSRMKRLVQVYSEKMVCTDFADYTALEALLHSLHQTFREFKCHEQIENKFIMKKLKKKLKALSIHDAAVCNCHSDNRLSDILALVHDGYSCTNKPVSERVNYGLKLQHALDEFRDEFLPHMKEEEEVFQPMLIQYFGYEELKRLKELVIQEHYKWQEQIRKEKCCTELEDIDKKEDSDTQTSPTTTVSDLPNEIMLKIFSLLPPRDLLLLGGVSQRWYTLSRDPFLWKDLFPVHWARGVWNVNMDYPLEPVSCELGSACDSETCSGGYYDEDADVDESSSDEESKDSCHKSRLLKTETSVLACIVKHFLPHVGSGVKKLVLSTSEGLTDSLLHSILCLCPNVEYLDLSYTKVGDSSFKRLWEYRACSSLTYLNLAGCANISDAALYRIGQCLLYQTDQMSDIDDRQGSFSEIQTIAIEENQICVRSTMAKVLVCDRKRFCDQCPYKQRCAGIATFSVREAAQLNRNLAKVLLTKNGKLCGLKHINLSGCFQVTDLGLRYFSDNGLLSGLEFLDVSGCWKMTGSGLCTVVNYAPKLLPENLYYCDYIEEGPYLESANGCQNLHCGIRACCCSGE